MMGRQAEQEQLFYRFRLEDHVPQDHRARAGLTGFSTWAACAGTSPPFTARSAGPRSTLSS